MADDNEVTVDVMSRLTGLDQTLDDANSKLESFAAQPITKEVNIVVNRPASSEFALPSYQDPQNQYDALHRVGEQLENRMSKLGEDSPLFDKLKASLAQVDEALNALRASGVTHGKAAPDYTPDGLPEMPNLMDPAEQRAALLEQGKDLDALLEKYERLGMGGEAAVQRLAERVAFINQQLEDMDAAEEKAHKNDKAPAPPKPPKLPKPAKEPKGGGGGTPPEDIDDMAGKATGGFGRLVAAIGLGTLAAQAAGKAIHAVFEGIEAAIRRTIDLIDAAVKATIAATDEMRKLSNVFGSGAQGQAAVDESKRVTAGTGIDPRVVQALMPELEAKTRGQLSKGDGLQMVVDVAARLDPTRINEFAGAISGAYAELRTGGNMRGTLEQMVQLGMISGDTQRRLEMMNRMGVDMKTQWMELQSALKTGAEGADKANQSFGGLMTQLGTKISSTWFEMTSTIGKTLGKAMGPALGEAMTALDRIKPKLMDLATWAGEVLGSLATWISGVVSGAIKGLATLRNMFLNGDLGEFVFLAFSVGMLTALNSFVDGLSKGIQWTIDSLVTGFKILVNAEFWNAIGNLLLANAYGFISVMAGLGTVLYAAVSPVMVYINAAMAMAGSKLLGLLMQGAALLKSGKEKDDMWNEGQSLRDLTWDKAKKQAQSDANANINAGLDKSVEYGAKSADALSKAAGNISQAYTESTNGKSWDDYKGPNALGEKIDGITNRMTELWDKNKPADSKSADPKRRPGGVDLVDVIGQSGPKTVADSLQQVGGGGYSSGFNWQDSMLDETKKQTTYLATLAGRTVSTGSAYGSGGVGQEGTPVATLLTNINNTLLSMLGIMRAGGKGTMVTTRT